jgi:hypothetical protein
MMNKNKILGIITIIFMVLVSAVPVFAATSTTQTAQVTVSDTIAIEAFFNSVQNANINLGSIVADGNTNTVNGESLVTKSNVRIDVYTRASGNFAGGIIPDTIALSNFRWSIGSPTPYTNAYVKVIDDWAKAPKGGSLSQAVTFDIAAPVGTEPGDYTTTVYFSAVKHNAAAPTTP